MALERTDVAVGVPRRPECEPGSPGGLAVRRQFVSGARLEMRGADSFGRGGRARHGTGPHGLVRRGFMIASSLVIGAVVVLSTIQYFIVRIGISASLTAGLIVVIAAIIPACFLLEKSFLGDRLDWGLWVYFATELVFTTVLWRLSTGGWFNYAIQAVIVGCVLTARALTRACESSVSWRALLPAVIAVAAVPVFAWTDAKQVVARRAIETKETARLLTRVPNPASAIFFVDRSGANRLYGRRDLVYDPWLYPVFESIGLAKPRSEWLEPAIATGPVRYVATTSSVTEVEGLRRTLPELGFSRTARVGGYFLWVRRTPSTP